jgi:hypothetical protein
MFFWPLSCPWIPTTIPQCAFFDLCKKIPSTTYSTISPWPTTSFWFGFHETSIDTSKSPSGCMHSRVAHFQQLLHSLKVHTVVLKWKSILTSLIEWGITWWSMN